MNLTKFSKKPFLLFCAILTFLFFLLNFKFGHFIIGNDNFSPELNPAVTLKKLLVSPGWREYRALGVMSDSEQTDIFRASFFYILDLFFVPNWFISQFYVYVGLFFALYGSGSLTYFFLKNHLVLHKKLYIKIMGSFFYVFNLLGVWIFFSPTHQFFAAFCFLPFLFFRTLSFIDKPLLKNYFFMLLSFLLIMATGLTATIYLIVLVLFALLTLFYWFLSNNRSFKTIFIISATALLLNLYWLLPFSLYVVSNTSSLKDSLIYRKITPDVISTESRNNSVENVFAYRFFWLESKSNNAYDYAYASFYKENLFVKFVLAINVILYTLGLFIAIKKRNKLLIFAGILSVIGIYFIKGQNPPFGEFYIWLQNTFPTFFGQVFRWSSSKFWPFMVMTIPTISTYAFFYVLAFFEKKFYIKRVYIPIFFVLFLQLINVYPFFRGYMIGNRSYAKVPKEYFEMASYINSYYGNSRMYVLPESNTTYFKAHNWGFWGSVFWNYLTFNPTFEKALVIGSTESEEAFYKIRSSYYSQNPEYFIRSLRKYGVDTVLVDTSVVKDIGYELDLDILEKQILTSKYFLPVKKIGNLGLYKLNFYDSTNLLGITDSNSQLRIFELPQSKVSISDDLIKVSAKLSKDQQKNYQFVYNAKDINSSPSQFTFQPNKIIVSPLTVTIDNLTLLNLPTKTFSFETQSPAFFSSGRQVFSAYENVNTTIPFETVQNDGVPYIWKNNFLVQNILDSSLIKCKNDQNILSTLNLEQKLECESNKIKLNKSSIIDFNLEINVTNPVVVSLCIFSDDLQSCSNEATRSKIVFDKGSFVFTSPYILIENDDLTFYLNITPMKTELATQVNVTKADVRIFSDYEKTKLIDSFLLNDVFLNFSTVDKDILNYSIPILQGAGSVNYSINNNIIPDFSTGTYSTMGARKIEEFATIEKIDSSSLVLSNKNASSALYGQIMDMDFYDSILTLVVGKNKSGIPSDLRFRTSTNYYPLWENKLYPKDSSDFLQVIKRPQDQTNYVIDVLNNAYGLETSVNEIQNIIVQNVPSYWAAFSLLPLEVNKRNYYKMQSPSKIPSNVFLYQYQQTQSLEKTESNIMFIPTATSPYWKIKYTSKTNLSQNLTSLYFSYLFGSKEPNVEPSKVNNWMQSWEFKEPVKEGTYIVVFWPNLVIFAGYIFVILLLVTTFVIYYVRRFFPKKHKLYSKQEQIHNH